DGSRRPGRSSIASSGRSSPCATPISWNVSPSTRGRAKRSFTASTGAIARSFIAAPAHPASGSRSRASTRSRRNDIKNRYSRGFDRIPSIVYVENADHCRWPHAMAQNRSKILCIEDDRETAALIAEELSDRGYEVVVAHDGQEGFAAILRTMPDL